MGGGGCGEPLFPEINRAVDLNRKGAPGEHKKPWGNLTLPNVLSLTFGIA